ncbi:hypothetical protein FGO68_gene17518 [Halteria grandinella]|uniref:Uncharacterized protein n=1 Tax=Halteria grandinella TaxID=5974 RepID=A0A8J8P5P5_HALGN|nr:hypothetical protein FGO68_gene17518 [Halteria grandinella]
MRKEEDLMQCTNPNVNALQITPLEFVGVDLAYLSNQISLLSIYYVGAIHLEIELTLSPFYSMQITAAIGKPNQNIQALNLQILFTISKLFFSKMFDSYTTISGTSEGQVREVALLWMRFLIAKPWKADGAELAIPYGIEIAEDL